MEIMQSNAVRKKAALRASLVRSASSALFSLADVSSDFRRADHFAVDVLDRRNRQRHVDPRAIFFQAHCFEMLDALAANQSLHNAAQLRLPVRWDDHRYGLTDCLLRREPIEPFGGGIPTGNGSTEVFSNNCIIGVFDDCCQSLGVFLGASYLCGVAKNQDDAENLADLIL